MNRVYPPLLSKVAVIAALVSPFALAAQPAPAPAAANPSDDEMVVLSPFTVSAASTGRYQATEATSGARVRVSLMDSTQHVSVVTRDLMDDIGIGRLLDAAKYAAGISEATIPNAQDRTNIRGFQNDGVTLDGFGYFSFANLDPVVVDRLEVVKGPNAILAPQGVPGGTVNVVSRKPLFTNRGYVAAQYGEYSGARGEFDVNRVLQSNKLAVRVVGAAQQADDYGDRNFHRSNIVMPMVTYRFTPATEVTFQLEAYDWRALNYLGIPLDPYVGTNDKAITIRGVPQTAGFYDDDTYRYQKALHARLFFTTNFTDRFSMRVAGSWLSSSASSSQSNLSGPNPGHLDPATGLWLASTAPLGASRTYSRSYGFGAQFRRNFDLQNDFAYHFKNGSVDSTTVAGYWLSHAVVFDRGNNYTKPTFNIDAFTSADPTFTSISGRTMNNSRTKQVYVSENLSLFDNRLVLSGGVARAYYQIRIDDQLRTLRAANDTDATLPSYGAVVRVIPQVSLFYGVSKQSTPIGPSTTSTIPFRLQTSRQSEYGVRVQVLENRVYATLSHFDIKQNNFSVPNPANLTVPPPNPALPALFMDRLAHGWELEASAAITSNLSLIGNYTSFKNRTPFGQPFRGTAEKSGALWVSYAFKANALKGLTLGVGVDYLDKRPGDAPSSSPTSASTPTNLILPQPTFWLPARTLINASIQYSWQTHWQAQLNVDNVLDKDYLAASINRFLVYPGVPITTRLTVSRKF